MKFQRTYTDSEGTSIWTYDLDKFKNGPISVERIFKDEPQVKKKRRTK